MIRPEDTPTGGVATTATPPSTITPPGKPLPREWLTTMAVRPGMRVHDGGAAAPEHTVAGKRYLGDGDWWIGYADGGCAVHGARHGWLVEAR